MGINLRIVVQWLGLLGVRHPCLLLHGLDRYHLSRKYWNNWSDLLYVPSPTGVSVYRSGGWSP